MNNLSKGLFAGFIATSILSILIIINAYYGLFPELNVINMQWNLFSNALNIPMTTPLSGWIIHFAIGTLLWGGMFGAFNHAIPGSTELSKGISVGLLAWGIMMLVIMPLAGLDFFGLVLGYSAPVTTLALHIIFGLIMGYAYAKLIHVRPTALLKLVEIVE